MRILQVNYTSARNLAAEGRSKLKMDKNDPWTEELLRKCVQMFEIKSKGRNLMVHQQSNGRSPVQMIGKSITSILDGTHRNVPKQIAPSKLLSGDDDDDYNLFEDDTSIASTDSAIDCLAALNTSTDSFSLESDTSSDLTPLGCAPPDDTLASESEELLASVSIMNVSLIEGRKQKIDEQSVEPAVDVQPTFQGGSPIVHKSSPSKPSMSSLPKVDCDEPAVELEGPPALKRKSLTPSIAQPASEKSQVLSIVGSAQSTSLSVATEMENKDEEYVPRAVHVYGKSVKVIGSSQASRTSSRKSTPTSATVAETSTKTFMTGDLTLRNPDRQVFGVLFEC